MKSSILDKMKKVVEVLLLLCSIVAFAYYASNLVVYLMDINNNKKIQEDLIKEVVTTTKSTDNKESGFSFDLFNSIENTELTAENCKQLTDEYMEKNKDNDKAYYLSYSMLYSMMKDGISSAFLNPENQNAIYEGVLCRKII